MGSTFMLNIIYLSSTNLALAGPSGICARWGIETYGRFEAERLPSSAGPPSGGRAATLTPRPRFGFVIQLGSLDPHCTLWVNEQHRPAGFGHRLVPDLPLP